MHKIFVILPVLIVMILLSACSKYPCSKAWRNFALIGFSDAETDTIILRRLTKNSNLVKDSFLFNPENPIRFRRASDTLTIVASTSEADLESDYDYEIFFPITGKQYKITNLNEKIQYGRRSLFDTRKVGCGNSIDSYYLDGKLINTVPRYIYLRK